MEYQKTNPYKKRASAHFLILIIVVDVSSVKCVATFRWLHIYIYIYIYYIIYILYYILDIIYSIKNRHKLNIEISKNNQYQKSAHPRVVWYWLYLLMFHQLNLLRHLGDYINIYVYIIYIYIHIYIYILYIQYIIYIYIIIYIIYIIYIYILHI